MDEILLMLPGPTTVHPIERPTPSDITNNPPTNKIIRLIHIKIPHICLKSIVFPVK